MTDEVDRILVVMAHPDDVDFSSAATVAKWTAAGAQVTYLIVTAGDAGGYDETPRAEVAGLRMREQRAAAASVGVTDVRFLDGYADGYVEPTHELKRDIVRVIRQVRPQRILTMSPERSYDRIWQSHPDHLAVGDAVVSAIYPAAENPFSYPELLGDEGLRPCRVDELWLAGHPAPNHEVPVSEADLQGKLDALMAHASQMPDRDALEQLIRHRLTTRDRLTDSPMAESFLVATMHDPKELAHSTA